MQPEEDIIVCGYIQDRPIIEDITDKLIDKSIILSEVTSGYPIINQLEYVEEGLGI